MRLLFVGRKDRGMITITMPMWFAVSLTIYLVLDMIAKILKATIDEVENRRNREYRRQMNELIENAKHIRYIREWKERKGKE